MPQRLIEASLNTNRQRGLLLACCVAGAAKALEPPAWIFVPPGHELFDAGWVNIRFMTSIGAVIVVLAVLGGGLLGDIYGRRRLLLVGLGATALANTCLVFSLSPGWHLAWRLVAISGGAFVVPLALAPIYTCFQGRQQARAYGAYTLVTALALLITARQGQVMIAALDWRAAYLAPALFSLLALVLTWKYVPEQRVAARHHAIAFHQIGLTLIVLGVLFGALEAVVVMGWLLIVATGAAFLLLLGVIAFAHGTFQSPMTVLRSVTAHQRDVAALVVLGFVLQLLLMGFYLPTYDLFELGKGRTTVMTVVALAPLGLGMLTALVFVARLLHARRVGETLSVGLLLVAASIAVMAVQPLTIPYIVQATALFVFGMALLVTKTVWTNGLFQTLAGEYVGVNAAMNGAAVLLGGAVGAVLGTQLPVRFGQAALTATLPASFAGAEGAQAVERIVAIQLVRAPETGIMVVQPLLAAYQAALAQGYGMTCLSLAVVALVVGLLTALAVRRSLRFQRRVVGKAMLD